MRRTKRPTRPRTKLRLPERRYGGVFAASRPTDNVVLNDLAARTRHRIDMLVVTGSNTFENQQAVISSAVTRGVVVRVVQFDQAGPNAACMESLLGHNESEMQRHLAAAMINVHAIRKEVTAASPEGLKRILVHRTNILIAFDLILFDRSTIWYHPFMPHFDPIFPSFILKPPPASD